MPEYPNVPSLLERIATKAGTGGFYQLADFGINGAYCLDILCTKSAGAMCWRDKSILPELEPAEGALIGEPLVGSWPEMRALSPARSSGSRRPAVPAAARPRL